MLNETRDEYDVYGGSPTSEAELLKRLRGIYKGSKIKTGTGVFEVLVRYEDGGIVTGYGLQFLAGEPVPMVRTKEGHTVMNAGGGRVAKKITVNSDGSCTGALKANAKNTLHVVCPAGNEVMVREIGEYDFGNTCDRIVFIRAITDKDRKQHLAVCVETMSSSWTRYRLYKVSEDGIVSERKI